MSYREADNHKLKGIYLMDQIVMYNI